MKRYFLALFLATYVLAGCSSHAENKEHNHEQEEEHGHEHAEDDHHHHDEIKQQLIQYTDAYELYAEASPFVLGEEADVLVHLTRLSNFKPVDGTAIEAVLTVGGADTPMVSGTLKNGIARLAVEPQKAGEGVFKLEVKESDGTKAISVPVNVFKDDHEPHHYFGEEAEPVNSVHFTKEQSWKVDFATSLPSVKPFGQLIKTTAKVEALPSKTITLTAKAHGIVQFNSGGLVTGSTISPGQELIRIVGSGMGDENASLIYQTAQGEYELAKAEFERMQQLAEKQIVSQREFQEAKTTFERSQARFNNLKQNFSAEGQRVVSPKTGVIEEILVKNGQHVSTGDPLLRIASYARVLLVAYAPQKYSSKLSQIQDASYFCAEHQWETIDGVNGTLLKVGQRTQESNQLIPVYFEVDNPGEFIPGSFVEMNLTTASAQDRIVVPASSLIEQEGNFFVFVQINPELFEKRQVFPGDSNGVETAINRGLNADERIVTKGAVMLKLASVSSSIDPHAGHVH